MTQGIYIIVVFQQAKSTEETMLLDACDETSYMNADGTYTTTQPGGYGNIQVSRHDTTVRMNSEERPTFQVTLRLSAPHVGQRLI